MSSTKQLLHAVGLEHIPFGDEELQFRAGLRRAHRYRETLQRIERLTANVCEEECIHAGCEAHRAAEGALFE
jgi:hypothetical protein